MNTESNVRRKSLRNKKPVNYVEDFDDVDLKNNRKKPLVNDDFVYEDRISIDFFPNEILAKIFQNLQFSERLKCEIVSRRWGLLLREQSWLGFETLRLCSAHPSEKVRILFKRSREHLRELVVACSNPKITAKLDKALGPVFDWVALLHSVNSLCIVHHQLRRRHIAQLKPIAHQLECLHLESLIDEQNGQDATTMVDNQFSAFTSLRYFAVFRCKLNYQVHIGTFAGSLRMLKLDCSSDVASYVEEIEKQCSQLIALTLNIKCHTFNLHMRKSLELLQRLEQLELIFPRERIFLPPHIIVDSARNIMWMKNLRIAVLSHCDGNLLSELTQHCTRLEQLDYSTYNESILDAFVQICNLQNLRVLRAHHHGTATAETRSRIQVVAETLRMLANSGKLEYLSLNFNLPRETIVHIIRQCPALEFLEYPCTNATDLDVVLSTVYSVRSESSTGHAALRLCIPHKNWWTLKHGTRNPWKPCQLLKIRYFAPRKETNVMREFLAERIFDGPEQVPKFLVNWKEEGDEKNEEL